MKRYAAAFALTLSFAALAASGSHGGQAHAAQGQPEIQFGVDADTVGVGDTIRLEMSVTSSESMPSDPQIGATPGFQLRGQTSSPSQTHMNINGQVSDRYTLTVDYSLRATKVGTFSIGPPNVVVGGSRYSKGTVTLHVVPAGQAPPRPPQAQQQPFGFPFQFQFSPFDPWRSMFQPPGTPGAPQPPQAEPELPPTDPKLALDAPRGALFFLHATADKTSAVIGEPVVLAVYAYIDVTGRNIEIDDADVHDPDVADFVKRPLTKDDEPSAMGYASVGGRTWAVRLIRRWALFPLRAGNLAIGPMSLALAQPRSVAGTKRTSETFHVQVGEPPLAGRPPGYAIADVGHFTLGAQVQPRQAEQGGAVGVHLDVSGKGNVPSTIAVPSRPGVEWLTPQVHEQLGPIGKEAYGGTRSFDYVVRLTRTGNVDLGEISLPFWDPDARRYAVAAAALGTVNVAPTPAAQTAAGDSPERETLPGLPPPRTALEGTPVAKKHLDDALALWFGGITAGPISYAMVMALTALARRLSEAWSRRRNSPARDLKDRISAAQAACDTRDARGADAAIARALEAATIAYSGVNVRGAIGGEVAERLERSGVASDAAKSVAELLRECEAARFAPEAVEAAAAKERWLRAQGAIRSLERRA
jgi:hypothetical protein